MPKILYIEDNDDNVFMLKMRLELEDGFEVLVAGDGAAGVAAAERERPDLVLMDMNLPVMDGWQATSAIKMNPATRDIPIIALTAHAMSGDREKALAAGCNEFDTKPIDLERLLAKMRAVLARSSS